MKQLQIPDIDLNKELNKCKSMENLVGKNGLIQRLFGNIIQQFLEAEMEDHLGREKYEMITVKRKTIGMALETYLVYGLGSKKELSFGYQFAMT